VGQLLQIVLDNLYKLWPVRIIDVDSQGVKFSPKKVEKLDPGVHWFIPGWQEIEHWTVVYQEIDCQLQSIATTDNISVTFSANCGYTVQDASLMRTKVQHFDATLERALRSNLAEAVSDSEYVLTKRKRKSLCNAALKALRDETKDWGVTIEKVRLTDFVPAEQQRRFNSQDTQALL
jgi:regulator of protease activity HflC (stomatin/prohibitin superfamily)